MRCHAAEPGAVTSTDGFTHTQRDWRAGGSVGSPQGQLPGRESAALRTGLKGGPKIPPGSGCDEHWSGLEERPGSGKTPWWSAGWRAAPVWAASSPSQGEHI